MSIIKVSKIDESDSWNVYGFNMNAVLVNKDQLEFSRYD